MRIVLTTIGLYLVLTVGACTALERQQIFDQAREDAPELIEDIAQNPTPLGAAGAIAGYAAGIASGWFARRYRDKQKATQ